MHIFRPKLENDSSSLICFTVTQLDDERESKKLLDFLAKYEMVLENYDGPNQDDLILLGHTVVVDEGLWNPRMQPITAPIKLQDTEYAERSQQ